VLLGAPGIRPRRSIGVGISVLTQLGDTTTLMGPIPGLDGEAARFLIDGLLTVPDRYAQLTVEEFEFAAGDAPPTVRFVGPAPTVPSAGYVQPS
jgi:hypothetical protein